MQFHGGTTRKKGAELANKPPECIEYVLGHEMDDLLEPPHNARFFGNLGMTWQRNKFFRQMRARPRLYIATAFTILVGIFLPLDVASHGVTRWLIAWNAGTCLYVILAAIMMIRSSPHRMRHRAQ